MATDNPISFAALGLALLCLLPIRPAARSPLLRILLAGGAIAAAAIANPQVVLNVLATAGIWSLAAALPGLPTALSTDELAAPRQAPMAVACHSVPAANDSERRLPLDHGRGVVVFRTINGVLTSRLELVARA